MTNIIQSYRVDTTKLENSNSSGVERYTIRIKAPIGKVLSCYTMDNELYINIEHNDKYNGELEYVLLFVPNNFKLGLTGCTFINTVVRINYAGRQIFVKDIFNVYEKDRIIYT